VNKAIEEFKSLNGGKEPTPEELGEFMTEQVD